MSAILAAPAEATGGPASPAGARPGGALSDDRAGPGSAQEVMGEMAWLLRDARGGIVLGATVLWDWPSVNLLLGAVRIRCERVHLADTWTFVTAAAFGVWTALIFLA